MASLPSRESWVSREKVPILPFREKWLLDSTLSLTIPSVEEYSQSIQIPKSE